MHILKEIFWEGLYNPYIKQDGVVVDGGANSGLFTLWAYPWAKTIHAVEPSEIHFDTLMHMLTFNNMLDKVIPVKKALSNENKTVPMFHNPNTTMFSLSDAVKGDDQETEQVECVDIETLLKDIPHVDLLKVDTEGFESRIFAVESFDKVAPKIDTILCEHHSWSGVTPEQLEASFRDRGYKTTRLNTQATVIVATK